MQFAEGLLIVLIRGQDVVVCGNQGCRAIEAFEHLDQRQVLVRCDEAHGSAIIVSTWQVPRLDDRLELMVFSVISVA